MVAAVLLVVAPLLYGIATRRWRWASAPVARGCARRRAARERRVRPGPTKEARSSPGWRRAITRALCPRSFGIPRWTKPPISRPRRSWSTCDRSPADTRRGRRPAAYFEKGYLWMKSPADWPALAPTRGTLFEIPDALGYNPVQLPRYWRYIRATNELSVFYNASVLNTPSVEDVRLLGLRYLVVPTGLEPPVEGRVVDAGRRVLPLGARRRTAPGDHERGGDARGRHPAGAGARDRAGLRPVDDRDRGTVDRRDTARRAARRRDRRTRPRRRRSGSAWTHLVAGVLTVRNAYEAGWRATADGTIRVRTLPVDGFLQGVLLPSSTREVVLTYHDDAVMLGLALGALVWACLLAAPLLALARERRAPSRDAGYAVSPTAARRRSSPSMNRSMSPPRTRDGSPTSTSVRWSFTIWYGAST